MEKIYIPIKYNDLCEGLGICKNCGHIEEWHEWDDYDGYSCNHTEGKYPDETRCDCEDFDILFENGYAIYDFKDSTSEGKLPKEIVDKHQRKDL